MTQIEWEVQKRFRTTTINSAFIIICHSPSLQFSKLFRIIFILVIYILKLNKIESKSLQKLIRIPSTYIFFYGNLNYKRKVTINWITFSNRC